MRLAPQSAQKVNVLGVQVDTYRLAALLEMIRVAIIANRRLLITHINVRGLHMAYENQWYRDFLNQSDVVYCDGMGVNLAARLLGEHIPERYTLADWHTQLFTLACENDFSVFFLGSPDGITELAAQNMRQKFPELSIVGTQHGFFDQTPSSPENQAAIHAINLRQPNLLMVGMGMPQQEKWLLENWESLDVNIAITCGAIFEYLAETLKHGPAWMTQNYMEWLFRLINQPKRYASRYLRDNPLLLWRVLRQKWIGLPFT